MANIGSVFVRTQQLRCTQCTEPEHFHKNPNIYFTRCLVSASRLSGSPSIKSITKIFSLFPPTCTGIQEWVTSYTASETSDELGKLIPIFQLW